MYIETLINMYQRIVEMIPRTLENIYTILNTSLGDLLGLENTPADILNISIIELMFVAVGTWIIYTMIKWLIDLLP